MAQDFYPFVENPNTDTAADGPIEAIVRHPARIAVYDDAAAAPRVVVIEPKDVRTYLEEITLQVTQLAQAQGGSIPFMVIREIVENFIHAYFMEPTISILDGGNTIRFSDQGPGIPEKERALQYGTTSATEEMRRYIRGVGSGLPYAQQYMSDKGGELTIEDNIAGGTVVTLSAQRKTPDQLPIAAQQAASPWTSPAGGTYAPYQQPAPVYTQQLPQQGYPAAPYQQSAYPMPATQPGMYLPTQPAPAPSVQGPGAWPQISVRGRAVLDYLAAHDSVGPKDLSLTFGESQPTWTRELQTLEQLGLVRKEGQKRVLTAMGHAMLAGQ